MTAAGLPPFAAVINPGDAVAVSIVRNGCRGYWPVTVGVDDMQAAAIVAGINAALGVTPPQAEAMQAGSIFGFDCPGADPASYDSRGNICMPPVYGADARPENDDPGPYQN